MHTSTYVHRALIRHKQDRQRSGILFFFIRGKNEKKKKQKKKTKTRDLSYVDILVKYGATTRTYIRVCMLAVYFDD